MPTQTLTGEQLAAITRALVSITSRHFGRGATEGKAYQCDDFVFCVLKGGLTVAERDLVAHGDEQLVRQLRLRLQTHNQAAFEHAVERIAGRRVLASQSQVLFDPDYTVEIFFLGADGPRESPAAARE